MSCPPTTTTNRPSSTYSWGRKCSNSNSVSFGSCNSSDTSCSSTDDKNCAAGKEGCEKNPCKPSESFSYNQDKMVHRLVKRNLPLYQSHNHVQVTNHQRMEFFNLLRHDWFHVILRANPNLSICLLLIIWTAVIILFACIYMLIDSGNKDTDCGLGEVGSPLAFGPAFAFSLETCTTVGYGLPGGTNAFFEDNCNSVQMVIYFQMVWSMMFNAFLFAFFFARLARGETRGVQIVFSDKAIVSHRKKSPGNPMLDARDECPFPCFQFRVFDIDSKHPVIEAHVRVFAVHRSTSVPHPLRLVQPDDEVGTYLFTSLPSEVVHSIDAYSSLSPPYRVPEGQAACLTLPGSGTVLRQVDSLVNSRDDVECPICADTFGCLDRLAIHGSYYAEQERLSGLPEGTGHQQIDWDKLRNHSKTPHYDGIQALKKYFEEEISEIICVVEGIEPLTSCTFQALHSYQIQDIYFGEATFADCVTLHKKDDKNLVVDLDAFHRIVPDQRKIPPIVDAPRKGESSLPDVWTPLRDDLETALTQTSAECET